MLLQGTCFSFLARRKMALKDTPRLWLFKELAETHVREEGEYVTRQTAFWFSLSNESLRAKCSCSEMPFLLLCQTLISKMPGFKHPAEPLGTVVHCQQIL